jgi:hypothetical protein
MSEFLIGTENGVFRLGHDGNLRMVRQTAVDAAGTVFAAAGSALFVSHNDGDSWQRLAEGLLTVQALVAV